ncbi:ATP-dependent helicase smarcad1, partial [Quaeritorhiza haematococci]
MSSSNKARYGGRKLASSSPHKTGVRPVEVTAEIQQQISKFRFGAAKETVKRSSEAAVKLPAKESSSHLGRSESNASEAMPRTQSTGSYYDRRDALTEENGKGEVSSGTSDRDGQRASRALSLSKRTEFDNLIADERESISGLNTKLLRRSHSVGPGEDESSSSSSSQPKRRRLIKKKDTRKPVETPPSPPKKAEVLIVDSDEDDLLPADVLLNEPVPTNERTTHETDKRNPQFQDAPETKRRRFIKKAEKLERVWETGSDQQSVIDLSSDVHIAGKNAEAEVQILDSREQSNACDVEADVETDADVEDDKSPHWTETALSFFNDASVEDIMARTDCTAGQARLAVSLRPFESLTHLEDTLASHKKLSSLISRYIDAMEQFAAVDEIIAECKTLSERFSQANQDDSPSLLKQPKSIHPKFQLKGYQLHGVAWLRCLFERRVGGILADEMGLGKTATIIAFLASLHESGATGPHLIIVPSSVLENWSREFARWCPSLRIFVYRGSQPERSIQRYELLEGKAEADVILTTYTIVTSTKEDRGFLKRMKLKSMILDEGHAVKNMASARFQHLTSLKISFRIIMTGTPLQNNLMELLALFTFIMPDLFASEGGVARVFSRRMDSSFSVDRIERVKQIMAPFVLRRLKENVLSDLPRKIRTVETCNATQRQRELYDQIAQLSQKWKVNESDGNQIKISDDGNVVGKDKKGVQNVLMQLRKAANHPLLLRSLYTDEILQKMARLLLKEDEFFDSNQQYIFEDMQVMSDFELHELCRRYKSVNSFKLEDDVLFDSGKLRKLREMLPAMIEKGDRIVMFSQFLQPIDIMELFLTKLSIPYLRMDGGTDVTDRQELIDMFNEDSSLKVFLITTKVGGCGINLTSANVVILFDMDFNPHNDSQ